MDFDNDTVRDAPHQAEPARGKVMVWLVLIVAAYVAVTSALAVASELGGSKILLSQMQVPAGVNPAQSQRVQAAFAALAERWNGCCALFTAPYALAAAAAAVLALLVIMRDNEKLRSALRAAVLLAALGRVGVTAVSYQVASDSVSSVVSAMAERPSDLGPQASLNDRAAAARRGGEMDRAADLTSDVASAGIAIGGGFVVLLWVIAGVLVAKRREAHGAPESDASGVVSSG